MILKSVTLEKFIQSAWMNISFLKGKVSDGKRNHKEDETYKYSIGFDNNFFMFYAGENILKEIYPLCL